MASSRSPVSVAATARVMALAQLAVIKPASAPVANETASEASRCRCCISTNSPAMAVIAAMASGTMIEAPSTVMVPEALMMGRSPSWRRMSGCAVCVRSVVAVMGDPRFD